MKPWTNPDGEVDLSSIALLSLKWLKENDKEACDRFSKAIMKSNVENYQRKGVVYANFDLLREVIEYTNKKMELHDKIMSDAHLE